MKLITTSSCTSSNVSPPNFALIANDDFVTEFGWKKKLVLLSFRRYLVEFESNYKQVIIFIYIFWAHALLCQGQCLQISRPSSQWFTRCDSMIDCPFHGWPSLYCLIVWVCAPCLAPPPPRLYLPTCPTITTVTPAATIETPVVN